MKQMGMNPLGFSADKPNASLELAVSGSPHSRWHKHVPSAVLPLPKLAITTCPEYDELGQQCPSCWHRHMPFCLICSSRSHSYNNMERTYSKERCPFPGLETKYRNAARITTSSRIRNQVNNGAVCHHNMRILHSICGARTAQEEPVCNTHWHHGSLTGRLQTAKKLLGGSSDSTKQVECGPCIHHPNSVDGRCVLYKCRSTRIWLCGQ